MMTEKVIYAGRIYTRTVLSTGELELRNEVGKLVRYGVPGCTCCADNYKCIANLLPFVEKIKYKRSK